MGKKRKGREIMRNDIIDYLQKEVYSRCKQPTNKFGMGCYYHIEAVVKNAEILAGKYGADIAKVILNELNYDKEKIALVHKCILNHRGSVKLERNSIEELCVADADAISHFDSVPSLLYLAYVEKGMDIEHGASFVREKLERSYNKLSDESKDVYKEKYEQVMAIFG